MKINNFFGAFLPKARSARGDNARHIFEKAIKKDIHDLDAYEVYADQLLKKGDKWNAFLTLRAAFRASQDTSIGVKLSRLIGTPTRFSLIDDAMAALFDPDFYISKYKDVAGSTSDGDVHYLLYGWKENRRPSKFFDPRVYSDLLDANPSEFLVALLFERHYVSGEAQVAKSEAWFKIEAPLATEWRNVKAAPISQDTRAVVIIPVFKGFNETLAAIYYCLKARCNEPYAVLVVNDCGPDKVLNDALLELAELGLFEYHLSEQNRGFVKTVNFSVELVPGELDIVLLNSDAFVFDGWFGRLMAHADADPSVATITPMSNNSTLSSYPLDNENIVALEVSPDEVDRIAAIVNKGKAVAAPTGVGFCFYMRRSILNEIGGFDEDTFKMGYGEENDFCMRALYQEYKNLLACDVFVYHVGSVSFSETKDKHYKDGQIGLVRKHPIYPVLVENFMSAEIMKRPRMNIDAARLCRELSGAHLIITHTWGGGVETYVDGLCKKFESGSEKYVILRSHEGYLVSVETKNKNKIFLPNLMNVDLRSELSFIFEIIRGLRPKSIHVNSLAGLNWKSEFDILRAIQDSGFSYTYFCHDYTAIACNYQLLRPDNFYVGSPTANDLDDWSHIPNQPAWGGICPPSERRDVYDDFLMAASMVLVPSNAAKAILETAFPRVSFSCVPHAEPTRVSMGGGRRQKDGEIRGVILGAIGPHKGSEVLNALARDAANRKLNISYYVVGYTDIDEKLTNLGVQVTGKYQNDDEAVALIKGIEPDYVLIPSIWPETFCYTLSFAFALSITPIVFDIGAQAERVRAYGEGILLPTRYMYDTHALSDFLVKLGSVSGKSNSDLGAE